MPKLRTYQTNFSGGLLSADAGGRVDLAAYENGCQVFDNWWPKSTGGAKRRPGSRYLNDCTNGIRLEPFIFNDTQRYLVAFNNDTNQTRRILIFQEDGTEVANFTWTDSITSMQEMSIAQLGDTMILSHQEWRSKVIKRTGATTFTLGNYEFEGQPGTNAYPKFMPFFKFAAPEVTIETSGFNGSVNIVASDTVFHPNLVGRAIRYRGKQILVTAYIAANTLVGNVLEDLDRGCLVTFTTGKPEDYEVGEICVGRDSGTKGEVIEIIGSQVVFAMIAGDWTETIGLLSGEEIEGLDSGNICKGAVASQIDPPPTAFWDEEAFSEERGWPGAVAFHSQRLWFGGSSSLPAHIFGSKVAAFFNFDTGEGLANESIQAQIATSQLTQIIDITSSRHLQVFTDVGEFYAPAYEDQPLTPETFDLVKQTSYGIKKGVPARVFDESTIYVQGRGTAIREFLWHNSQRGYSSDAISLLADDFVTDITDCEILYGGYGRPEQLMFFVNSDGTIVWFHGNRQEQIRQWGRWTTQGEYQSIAVIDDKLYAMVRRDIFNTTSNRYAIEVFDEQLTVDCGTDPLAYLATNSEGVLTNSQLDHLVGNDVAIVEHRYDVDAGALQEAIYYYGEYPVAAGGSIQLDRFTFFFVAGLKFDQLLTPMPTEMNDPTGIAGGLPKRLVSVSVLMNSTLALKVNGSAIRTYQGSTYSGAYADIKRQNGFQKFHLLGYDERPAVELVNDIPLECEVLAIAQEVEY